MRKLLALFMAAIIYSVCVLPGTAYAAGTCSIFRSWINGDQLTASDLTTSFITVGQTNMIPTCMDGDSPNVAGMQSTVDPFPGGTESLATNMKGELERLRFVIKNLTGWADWYKHDGNAFTASRTGITHAGTWNNAGVVFPGFLSVNVTNTASGAASLLFDLQVGGVSKFKVDKDGNVTQGGAGTFTSISATNNTNMVNLGTTNIGTFTLAGGALTAARTWTLPDITGIVALTNGGQTFTSAVWNGTIIGSTYGGTGINTSATVAGSVLYTSATGTWATATAGATGTVPRWNGTAVIFDHTSPLYAAVFN